MGFVRTPEEIEHMQELLHPARFVVEGLMVEFETTEEFLREVIPPCFEFERPYGTVTAARWQSATSGGLDTMAVNVFVRYGDLVGTYLLNFTVGGELAGGDSGIIFGRELWGECKKRGEVRIYRDSDNIAAYAERNGTQIIGIEATLGEELGAQEVEGHKFELKSQLAHDLSGLVANPTVLVFDVARSFSETRRASAELFLHGSEWDPVHEIPIESLSSALYFTGEASFRVGREDPLPDRDRYFPYVLAKYDDMALFRTPKRHRAPLSVAAASA